MADENNEMKEVKDEKELAPFDPTKKKKKKKIVSQDIIEEPTESQAETSEPLPANDGLEGPSFGTKKKKKKKPVESRSLDEESVDPSDDSLLMKRKRRKEFICSSNVIPGREVIGITFMTRRIISCCLGRKMLS
ncbi:hypothetical protein Bca101_026604 [Brassica carinata]